MSMPSADDYFYTCDELTPDLCSDLQVEESCVEIEGINVTYWIYYSLSATTRSINNNKKLPIISIHGGPSFTHNYLQPLKQQACRGRTIVFYDQAGCGKSPYYSDKVPKWLLDPLYYSTVELPTLVNHLVHISTSTPHHDFMNFQNGFHIIANSWGTMLSQFYALDDASRLQKLASMVLSGPFSDSQSYISAQWDAKEGNLGGLPPFLQQRIRALEAARSYTSLEYQALDSFLSGHFTLRTQPAPDCWIASEQQANMAIYTAMQGPSEFTMQGVLANVNLTGRMSEIDLPVLLSHGKYDTMRPSIVRTMQEQLPDAECLYLTRSGHVSMIDEPGPMNDGIATFFDRVENKNKALFHGGLTLHNVPQESHLTMTATKASFPSVKFSTSYGSMMHPSAVLIVTFVALTVGYVVGHWNGRRGMQWQYTHIR